MDRLQRLRDLLEANQLDGLFVSGPENRRYLSGFTGSAGFLLVTADRALLISDGRYTTQASQEAPGWEFRLMVPPATPLAAVLEEELRARPLKRLGFEAGNLSVAQYNQIADTLRSLTELAPTEGLIEQIRAVKDADELRLLERATTVTDEAFRRIKPLLRPTMREHEAAWEIEKALRESGADGLAFPVIVAAGLNSARPHHRPTDAELGRGQPIVLDFGARFRGYHGDMTRTVILGETNAEFDRIYHLVLDAQQHAATEVRPGLAGDAADALARERLGQAGYADAFSHSLGHGVGLAIHEGPSLRKGVTDLLPVGAVCSIEPGIYLPDWGGVRIEDLVVLEPNGARTLTTSSKDPLITWE